MKLFLLYISKSIRVHDYKLYNVSFFFKRLSFVTERRRSLAWVCVGGDFYILIMCENDLQALWKRKETINKWTHTQLLMQMQRMNCLLLFVTESGDGTLFYKSLVIKTCCTELLLSQQSSTQSLFLLWFNQSIMDMLSIVPKRSNLAPFTSEADSGCFFPSAVLRAQSIMGLSGPLQTPTEERKLLHDVLNASLVGLLPVRKTNQWI